MKLKTRLIIAFLTVILIPILLTVMLAVLFGKYQMSAIEKTYEITGMTTENLSNSVGVMSRLTEKFYNESDGVGESGEDGGRHISGGIQSEA